MRKLMLATVVCSLCLGVGIASAEFNPGEFLEGYAGKVPPEVRGLKQVNLPTAGRDFRAAGGPDSYGYVFEDSNEPTGPTYQWIELNGTGTREDLADDASVGPIALGFDFTFYAGTFNSIYISSNGHLTFGSGSTDFSNDCPFPDPGITPSNIVALNWDDFDPADNLDPIFHQSFAAGTCPWGGYAGACFVVEYEDFSFYNSGGAVNGDGGTFEAILFDNGEMVYQYMDPGVTSGGSASIGIANADGSIGLTYTCDTASLAADLAIRFYVSADFPDLQMSMSASATDIPPGGQLVKTLTVDHIGTIDATGVTVTDPLPSAVTYVSDTCGGSGTAPWTWNIGDLAAGGSASCDLVLQVNDCVAFTNTVSVAGDASEPIGNNTASQTFNLAYDALQDGSFEAGTPNPFWNEASTNFGTPLCDEGGCGTGGGTAGPLTGSWWAWFGGATTDETATADQDVILSGSPSLTFNLWAPTPGEVTARGTFDVYVDATSIFQIDQGDPAYSGGYTEVTLDLTPYADGGTHNLRFEGIQVGPDVVTFNLDDVALISCPTLGTADLTMTKTGESLVVGEGTYTLSVMNNGPDPTTDAVVTDPLPAGVTYLGDSCGGSFADPMWTWNIGALAAGSAVTCTIDVSISDYLLTDNVATVSASETDPVPGDNVGGGAIAPPPQPTEPAIPTLNSWGIAVLITIMAGMSLFLLRRRG